MRRIRAGSTFLALIPLLAFAAGLSAQTCTSQACEFLPGVPYVIPVGQAIGVLDGTIGAEWSGSFDKPTSVWVDGKRLPIDLYLIQDGDALYVGIRVEMKERSKEIFRVSLHLWYATTDSRGPTGNLILLAEDRGKGTGNVDYHFEHFSERVVDGSQDAWGTGKWDSYKRAYEFEVRLRLASGDPQDLALQPGVPFNLVVGLETVGRDGKMTSALESPGLLMTI